jgi:hypothetical protein
MRSFFLFTSHQSLVLHIFRDPLPLPVFATSQTSFPYLGSVMFLVLPLLLFLTCFVVGDAFMQAKSRQRCVSALCEAFSLHECLHCRTVLKASQMFGTMDTLMTCSFLVRDLRPDRPPELHTPTAWCDLIHTFSASRTPSRCP